MLFTHHFLPRVLLCLVVSGLNAFAPVFAATPGEQDLIRDRQDRLLQEQQRRLEELRELPGNEPPPVAPEPAPDTRCFPIDSIEIKGQATG